MLMKLFSLKYSTINELPFRLYAIISLNDVVDDKTEQSLLNKLLVLLNKTMKDQKKNIQKLEQIKQFIRRLIIIELFYLCITFHFKLQRYICIQQYLHSGARCPTWTRQRSGIWPSEISWEMAHHTIKIIRYLSTIYKLQVRYIPIILYSIPRTNFTPFNRVRYKISIQDQIILAEIKEKMTEISGDSRVHQIPEAILEEINSLQHNTIMENAFDYFSEVRL